MVGTSFGVYLYSNDVYLQWNEVGLKNGALNC